MAIVRVPGTQSDGTVYGDDFLPTGGTHTQLEPRRARGGYFFSSVSNPMGIYDSRLRTTENVFILLY
jgi:hypothetical protein